MKVIEPYEQDVRIADLVRDKSLQMRAALNRAAILDYAEGYERGDQMPPIVVFWAHGGRKFVGDGFHRILAAIKAGKKMIRATIHTGGKREAMLYAAQANSVHGVRRTNDDKRKAVLTLLGDKSWREWTDTTVAKHCSVSTAMVGRYRQWLGESANGATTPNGWTTRKYVDRTGRERTRDVNVNGRGADLDERLRGEKCPYCGQKMPGKAHKIR